MQSSARICLTPPSCDDAPPASIEAVESLLSEWFDAPVVLTSSGRSALLLAFQDLGLTRYKSRVAMSPMTSSCVLDAVIRVAFPTDAAVPTPNAAHATLVIHQYGHVQKVKPAGAVVEDICHNFFANSGTGARDWLGNYAAFSLPKFMSTSGMVGGLVLRSNAIAARVRRLRDKFVNGDPAELQKSRALWRRGSEGTDHTQLAALLNPAPDPHALGAVPATIDGLRSIGAQREANVKQILAELPESVLPDEWRGMCAVTLPFALPLFAERQDLMRLSQRLAPWLFDTSLYSIDMNKSLFEPNFHPALLLPTHHYIDVDELRDVCSELRLWNRR